MENIELSNNVEKQIDINEVIGIVWSRKFLISLITLAFALVSVIVSLLLPNIYTSKALLAPSKNENSVSSTISQYSAIAGIAGISLPTDSLNPSIEAVERIKSYDFFKSHVLPEIKLENLLAVKKWIPSNNSIVYDDNDFDEQSKKWVRKKTRTKEVVPSNQEAYREYRKILSISIDSKTSFISVSINHRSPVIAKQWLDLIIKHINESMRENDIDLAENSINFLNKTYESTSLQNIRLALSSLTEAQIQTLMLASANKDYVFKILDSPIAPELRSSPKRKLICIISIIIGMIFGILISIFTHYLNKNVQ